MKIQFTKMHALGNDFMVINGVQQKFIADATLIQQWADRHTGIGFDQLLLVETTKNPQADFVYRIFNADGGEVEQCGNGARCLAKFLHDEKLTEKNPIVVETLAGLLELKLENDGNVTVNLGVPVICSHPFPHPLPGGEGIGNSRRSAQGAPATEPTFDIGSVALDPTYNPTYIDIGNPHYVLIIDNITNAPVQTLGSELSNNPYFPNRTNVEFMQIVNSHHIRLRVYERGAGETQACGSGACAAVIAGRTLKKLDENVTVDLPGGKLQVSWQGENKPVFLTGPAITVYKGTIP